MNHKKSAKNKNKKRKPEIGTKSNVVTEFTDSWHSMRPMKKKFPQYTSMESRLKTYVKHPESLANRKESFAEAGFFYSGIADWVFCYCCGLGLKNWGDNEPPLHMHAVFNLFCPIAERCEDDISRYDHTFPSTYIITKEERRDMLLDTSGPEFKQNRFHLLKECIF